MVISFEGLDGSGKSTQLRRLESRLRGKGYDPTTLREPGGTAVSEAVRSLLLDAELAIDPFAEMLLFSAARAQLVREVIRPADEQGGLVLCDRFLDSTVAYQGAGRGVADAAWVAEFQRVVTAGVVPDRTYLIRLEPEDARARLLGRLGDDDGDRMERAGADFFARVAAAYDRLAAAEPERFCVVDGLRSEDEVEAAIWEDAESRLPEPPRRDPVDQS